MKKFLRYHQAIFLAIFILGFFLRVYAAKSLFLYSHDQDLAGWVIKDILVNRHLRLVGQQTSVLGVFVGPLFYYLLIPFYLLFDLDPIGGVVLSTLIGLATIASYYFVFSRVFSKKVGLIASFIHAVSFSTVFTDREVVPTTLVFLWVVWYFYAINLLLKGKQKFAFVLLGLLTGLVWHVNLGLALLVFLIPLALWLSGKKINWRAAGLGLLTLLLASLPLIVFEARHSFQQTRAVFGLLGSGQTGLEMGAGGFDRVLQLVSTNVNGLLWGPLPQISQVFALSLFLVAFLVLISKGVFSRPLATVMFVWLALYIGFFSKASLVLSEYYINGMTVVWIAIAASAIGYLLERKNLRKVGVVFLVLFLAANLYRFFSLDVNRSGYLERKALVRFIKEDAQRHDYPCVSVSYITAPGYELGYRYFSWLQNMHVNQPDSGSPVYTIVFPHKKVERLDQSFGALGLVLPEYERYNKEDVEVSCSGENSNLTDPMFGYTQ